MNQQKHQQQQPYQENGGQRDKMNLNLSVLNGLRCITCFCIITFHVHLRYGRYLFLSESICYHNVYKSIISIMFFRVSYQMSMFWMISGFLFEYQLHELYNKQQQQQQEQQQQHQSNNNNVITTKTTIKHEKQQQQNHRQQQQSYERTIYRNHYHMVKMNILDKDTSAVTMKWLQQYFLFFMNRIIRLYPLYFILVTCSYLSLLLIDNKYHHDIYNFGWYDYIKSLLFFKQWNDNNSIFIMCVTWSVQVNVHGYFAIILLFIITCQSTYNNNYNTIEKRTSRTMYKRWFLIVWFILSIIYIVLFYQPLPWQTLHWDVIMKVLKRGTIGLETTSDNRLTLLTQHGGYPNNPNVLYPSYDFHSPSNTALKKYATDIFNNTYMGGIFNHGVSIMLGSLLYLNIYVRNGNEYMPILKLLFSCAFLIISVGWHTLAGIPIYFLLDALLTMKPKNILLFNKKGELNKTRNSASNIQSTDYMKILEYACNQFTTYILKFLSNSLFTALSPYTYGIYLFHLMIVEYRFTNNLQSKIEAIMIGNREGINDSCVSLEQYAGFKYNIMFVMKESIIIFMITLFIAILLNVLIEQPIDRFRKNWKPTT